MPAPYLQQGFRPLLSVVVALVLPLLVSCASLPAPGEQPVKSANDDHKYRLLTLDNDMQVLLISDPGTPKAAAALDVMVGSGDNPPDRGGLAHFLEHMLFLGTDKYPDAAEYERYITEHGGATDSRHTKCLAEEALQADSTAGHPHNLFGLSMFLSVVYDQVVGSNLACMEVVARAYQLVEEIYCCC